MDGYNGENCSLTCPHPFFVKECQRQCNCSEDLCDISKGCPMETTGIYFIGTLKLWYIYTPNDEYTVWNVYFKGTKDIFWIYVNIMLLIDSGLILHYIYFIGYGGFFGWFFVCFCFFVWNNFFLIIIFAIQI